MGSSQGVDEERDSHEHHSDVQVVEPICEEGPWPEGIQPKQQLYCYEGQHDRRHASRSDLPSLLCRNGCVHTFTINIHAHKSREMQGGEPDSGLVLGLCTPECKSDDHLLGGGGLLLEIEKSIMTAERSIRSTTMTPSCHQRDSKMCLSFDLVLLCAQIKHYNLVC